VADPSPLVTSQGTDDAGVYRPISGFAIAGLALSALYTGLVLVSAIVGFFWPGYMILLPILGVSLSAVAMWQIYRSEGTRAGMKVAQWGVWLGIISGGGYAVYDAVTTLAIKIQANHFLMDAGEDAGFFPHFQKGDQADLNAAHLLTYPYSRRKGANPHDEEAMRLQFDTPQSPSPTGVLTQFLNSSFVRVFKQAALEHSPAVVEPAGIKSVEYTAMGPKVARYYRVTTPEVVMEIVVVVQSTENDSSGEGRKWFVVWPESSFVYPNTPIERTPAGKRMVNLRLHSRDFLDKWIEKDHRAVKDVPVVVKDARIPPGDRADIIADFRRTLDKTPAGKLARLLKFSDFRDPYFAFWRMPDSKTLRMEHSFTLMLLGDEGPQGFRYMGYGRCIVESPIPGDPLTTEFNPEWKFVEIALDRALPIPPGRK
jgi:hypothetical protein